MGGLGMGLVRALAAAALIGAAVTAVASDFGLTGNARYATDAFPGFDSEDDLISPSKKEPGLFWGWRGPKMTNATEQLAWCRQAAADGSWRAARKGLDALVKTWPTAKEAPVAQRELAEMYRDHYAEWENAFDEYRYLVDFYPSDCEHSQIVALMFSMAEKMREEGKTYMFFRFANTIDVRRAYESLVLRAPGAAFVPGAMMTIAQLREDEGAYEKAVLVYENLRNLHPKSAEALESLYREAKCRMVLQDDHTYNRDRTRDTIEFLRMALERQADDDRRAEMQKWLTRSQALIEDEAFRAAKFYDSTTRTRRSAINAYETFVREYPASAHVPEAAARLQALKAGGALGAKLPEKVTEGESK